jgi:hypothetical protein
MKEIKKNSEFACGRSLHPNNIGIPDKYIYSEKVFEFLDKHYIRIEA